MADGPGKYDDLCTIVRETSGASAAVVIVLNGVRGSGFSCQADGAVLGREVLADLLESVLRELRATS